jgi:hypothetical protein
VAGDEVWLDRCGPSWQMTVIVGEPQEVTSAAGG